MPPGSKPKLPSLGPINLALFSIFMLIAGIGSIVPVLVKDRLTEQFRPLWQRLLATPDDEWGFVGESVAIASQWIIGLTELTAAFLAATALTRPTHRLALAKAALGLATALFGAFMIVLFFLHEASLPKWNQYPAILVWIGLTWILVERDASALGTSRPGSARG